MQSIFKSLKEIAKGFLFISILIAIICTALLIITYKNQTMHLYLVSSLATLSKLVVNGSIKVDSIEGDLFSHVRIRNAEFFYYRTPEKPFVKIKDIELFWKPVYLFLDKKVFIDSLKITTPNFYFKRYLPQADWNIADFFKSKSKAKSKTDISFFATKIIIKDSNGIVDDSGKAYYTFKKLKMDAILTSSENGFYVLLNELDGKSNEQRFRCKLISIDKDELGINIKGKQLLLNERSVLTGIGGHLRGKEDILFKVRKSQVYYQDIYHFIPADLLFRGGYYTLTNTNIGYKEDSFFINSFAVSDSIPFYTLDFYKAKGRFDFWKKRLNMSDFYAKYFDTYWHLNYSNIDFRDFSYTGKGTFKGFNLKSTGVKGLRGKIDGQFMIKGKQFLPSKRHFNFKIITKGILFQDYSSSFVEAAGVYNPSNVNFSNLKIASKNGVVDFKGTVFRNGNFDLSVKSSNFPLLKPLPFKGLASFNGQLKGSLKNLAVQGRGNIRNFGWEGVYASNLTINNLLIQGINTSDFNYFFMGNVNLNAQGVNIGRIEANTGEVLAFFQPNNIIIQRAKFELPDFLVVTRGNWELSTVYKELYLNNTRIQSAKGVFTNINPIHLSFGDRGIEVQSMQFNYAKSGFDKKLGTVKVGGYFTYSGDINRINIKGNKFNIGELSGLFFPRHRISSTADFDMVLKGSFSNPQINGKVDLHKTVYHTGSVKNLGISQKLNDLRKPDEHSEDPFALKEVKPTSIQSEFGKIDFSYKDGWLNIENASFYQNKIPSVVKGRIPVKGSSDKDEIDMQMDIKGIDTDLLGLFTDIITLNKGDVSFKGTLKGTLEKPEIDGKMSIENGQVVFIPTGTIFTGVNAYLAFVYDRILFGGDPYFIEAKTPEGGNIYVNGKLDIGGFKLNHILAKIEAQDILFDAIPDIVIKGDASLFVYGPPDHILVKGNVELTEGLISIPFNQEETIEYNPSSGALQYDLRIRGDNNIWLKNQDMNAEIQVDMGFKWWNKDIIFIGNLETLRGEYYILGNEMKIEEGSLIFNNNPEFNPRLNIIASTMIRGSVREEDTIIKAKLTGTLRKSNLELTAYDYLEFPKKDYSQADILSMIALRMTWADLERSKPSGVMRNQGLTTALTSVSVLMTRGLGKNFGLSTFYIKTDLGATSSKTLEVTAGRYILRNLYLSYTQDIVNKREQEISLEYMLNRIHSVQVSTDYDKDLKERLFNLDWKILFKY
ncbi:MAG: translocation/assembly module TamB domain-containing protein [Candidatus Coatesbacteria bacterium]|nr:translocation/assembly module TamB domain-containing protein [Candidatus Coatesbacteria bacterium]